MILSSDQLECYMQVKKKTSQVNKSFHIDQTKSSLRWTKTNILRSARLINDKNKNDERINEQIAERLLSESWFRTPNESTLSQSVILIVLDLSSSDGKSSTEGKRSSTRNIKKNKSDGKVSERAIQKAILWSSAYERVEWAVFHLFCKGWRKYMKTLEETSKSQRKMRSSKKRSDNEPIISFVVQKAAGGMIRVLSCWRKFKGSEKKKQGNCHQIEKIDKRTIQTQNHVNQSNSSVTSTNTTIWIRSRRADENGMSTVSRAASSSYPEQGGKEN